MSTLNFTPLLLLLYIIAPTYARDRHVIHLPSALNPSSVSYDPSSQHFLLESRHLPSSSIISSASDAGTTQTLITTSTTSSSSSITSISVDAVRLRLIFVSDSAISAYDLRSPVPHRLIFSSAISGSASAVDVSGGSGDAFVATVSGEIFKADMYGNVSALASVGGEISGLTYVSLGFLLVIGPNGIFKVDAEDGVVRKVLFTSSSSDTAMEKVAVRRDGIVVAGGKTARWVKSNDGWAQAATYDEYTVLDNEKIVDVVVRDGVSVYVLVDKEGLNGNMSRIEEVEWGKDGEGELVWVMVLVGLGLAYFMYWRLQMGKLVESVNKKRM